MSGCHACGGQAAPDFRLSSGPVHRCVACGSLFRHPMPDAAALDALYSSEYFEMEYFDESADMSPAQERFLEVVAGLGRGGSLLDIGCGTGNFCLRAQRMGLHATGLEREGAAGDVAEARGVPVVRGLAQECAGALEGPYDFITLWDVAEHVPDPGALLHSAAGLLAPGGLLGLSLPGAEASLVRLARLLHRVGLRGPLERCFPPYHLFYPSGKGLEALCAGVGLRVAETFDYDPDLKSLRMGRVARFGVGLFSLMLSAGGGRINIFALAEKPKNNSAREDTAA